MMKKFLRLLMSVLGIVLCVIAGLLAVSVWYGYQLGSFEDATRAKRPASPTTAPRSPGSSR